MLKQLMQKLFNREPTPLPPPPVAPLMPRAVDISGNIFHFRMPENFSPDMPAKPLKEYVDLKTETDFGDNNAAALIMRWWDFKDPRYYRYGIGSLVLTGAVIRRPNDCQDDLSDYDKLIQLIHKKLQIQYETHHQRLIEQGDEELMTLIPEYPEDYGFVDLNGQTWMKHTLVGQFDMHIFYLPLATNHYLKVAFRFTKTTFNLNPEDYWPQFEAAEARILSTLYMDFAKNNPVGERVKSSNNRQRLKERPGWLPRGMADSPLLPDED